MQPSLTTSLRIAYAELTANSDLIKKTRAVNKVAFVLVCFPYMQWHHHHHQQQHHQQHSITCTKQSTQAYLNPSSHGPTSTSEWLTATCLWPMLTSNLSHCLRNPRKVLRLDGIYFLPNTKQVKGNLERCAYIYIYIYIQIYPITLRYSKLQSAAITYLNYHCPF